MINALADVLVQAKGGDNTPRDEFVRALCAAVVAQEKYPSNIHTALFHGRIHTYPDISHQSEEVEEWIGAAVAIGDHELLRTLLAQMTPAQRTLPLQSEIMGHPLVYAARKGFFDCAKMLLDYFHSLPETYTPDSSLVTDAIQAAIEKKDADMTKYLVAWHEDHCPKPEKPVYAKWLDTAVMHARDAQIVECLLRVRISRQRRVDYSLFRKACWASSPDVVRLLLKPIKPNKVYPLGTPLGDAVACGRIDIVRLVLDAGAHPDGPISFAGYPVENPLEIAVCYGRTEIVKMLIKDGADLFYGRCGQPIDPLIRALRLRPIDKGLYNCVRRAMIKRCGGTLRAWWEVPTLEKLQEAERVKAEIREAERLKMLGISAG